MFLYLISSIFFFGFMNLFNNTDYEIGYVVITYLIQITEKI